jgi:predicted RNase H-like nuclease (RuvC/YqgF family)
MEKLNDAVTAVEELVVNQYVEISHLSQENKELQQKVTTLEEELAQCKTEMMTLSKIKNKHLPRSSNKLFGWF